MPRWLASAVVGLQRGQAAVAAHGQQAQRQRRRGIERRLRLLAGRREPEAEAVRALGQQLHQRRLAAIGPAQRQVLHRARAFGQLRRGRVVVGDRHAPGVHQRPRKRMARRQRHHGAAQRVLGRRARRQEACRSARHLQVLLRGGLALGVVAVEQRIAGLALRDQRELPAEVRRILDAAVAPARAERTHHMRRIADEEHAAMPEAVEQVVAVAVRPDPHELELHVRPELLAQPRARHFGLADVGRVAVFGHLVVDAPHAVGHQVLPHAAAFVEGRIDPGPALGRQRLLEAHVADAPAVGAARRVRLDAELRADRAVGARGVDQAVGLDGVAAGGRFDVERARRRPAARRASRGSSSAGRSARVRGCARPGTTRRRTAAG